MQGLENIRYKLQAFIRKYYINELIKGLLLFTATGLLYLIATLLVEHFLWLETFGRTVLFWLFVGVELFLLYKFIAIPILQLLRIRKGIDDKEASGIIGRYFPEVGDKLLNVLQLSDESKLPGNNNELLLAGIAQKSAELQPFPFHIAVDFRGNLRYVKYALIPVVLIVIVWVSGNINWFSDSYKRVVHYREAYEPPAPFRFFVINNQLRGIEGKPFEIEVKTSGDVVPEDVEIHFKNENYFMRKDAPGSFRYEFRRPEENTVFYLSANGVRSRPYTLEIVAAPVMTAFEMYLRYPGYLHRSPDTLTGTGNARVPEGTEITWRLNTKNTAGVRWVSQDSVMHFRELSRDEEGITFDGSMRMFHDTDYEITTGNKALPDYESLGFGISVIKDEYPEIEVKQIRDSLKTSGQYFAGQVSDDYGLSGLSINYYPDGEEEAVQTSKIPMNTASNVHRFVSVFPADLDLKEGINYMIYFEVRDNDALHGGKAVKSGLFSYRVRTVQELEKENMEQQKNAIRSMERSMEEMKDQRQELKEINTLNMEKERKSFSERQKIDNFLERQLQQEKIMQRFTKELEERLDEAPSAEDEQARKLLEERLERQREELQKNEKLLEELKEVADKINQEDMARRLEKLSKSKQNSRKNLEQVLELTKRYYVSQNAERLRQELERLAKEQDKAAEDEKEEEQSAEKVQEDKTGAQEELNKKFDELRKEMEELDRDNKALKKPMDIGRDEKKEEAVSDDQQKALEDIKEDKQEEAKKKQKGAAQKMRQMAETMKSNMQGGASDNDMEDAEVLRQILKNLVSFSFEQESLMKVVEDMRPDHPALSQSLRRQHNLKEMFMHIDDSIFALSLRRPELSEQVNKEVTEAHFYLDKSIEQLSDNEIYRGASSQHYTFTAANNLAALLSNILDNLQQNMGMGQGSGDNEMQLPDIIQGQEELNEKMKNAMDGKGSPQEGEEGEKREGNGQGEDGDSEALFEIYKEQQMLREALRKQLEKQGGSGNGKDKMLREMERVEDELLKNGMNRETMKRMQKLQYELLKLKEGIREQGTEERRESRTNTKEYAPGQEGSIPGLDEYLQGMEILNRQVLPLRQIYKEKVKAYFKKDD